MSIRRHLNKEGISHANADSKTHARHVSQRKARRHVEWVPEVVEDTGATEFRLRDVLGLSKGEYFTGFGESELKVSGPEFEKHCSSVNWERRWNYAPMKRKEKVCKVRRKRNTPACEESVTNFSPAQMHFINGEIDRWKAAGIPQEKSQELLRKLVDETRQEVVEEFERATGRDVVGSYIHWDSNKIHIGIIHSRVGPDNDLVGDKFLGTVGPWTVGQNRLSKLGLVDAGDCRLKENLERFADRFGKDRIPLDLRLHDKLDSCFEKAVSGMGGDAAKRFKVSEKYYCDWKNRNRREAFSHSPSSSRIAWQTLRLVSPLFPPQVRMGIHAARTALEVFRFIGMALDAVPQSPQINPDQPHKNYANPRL